MKHGYGAPFVRVFNEKEDLIIDGVTRFKYVHSEKVDDASFITIETDNLDLVDHPDLQEKKKIHVLWGYLGGDNQKRILYLWDVKCNFDEQGIRIELECYCKAAYMKLNSSKDVYNNATMEDVGREMADAYGLNFKTENIDPANEEKPSDYYALTIGGKTTSKVDLEDRGRITTARDNTAFVQKYIFKRYDEGIPQANRNDQKLLQDIAKTEPVDNIMFETRDDDLIIKRRNFLQRPYKAYQFRAEPGTLLAFNPGTKNSTKKKSGISNTVAGWIEEEKAYMQGQVDRSQSGAGVLGDLVELSLEQSIKDRVQKDLYNPLDRPLSVDGLSQEQMVSKDENGNPVTRQVFTEKLDSTKAAFVWFKKQGTQPSRLVLDHKHAFISSALDVTGRIETRGTVVVDPKEYIPTVENKVQNMAGVGVNRQSNAELELIESDAKIVGDPGLISGKVITITGVGKRFSGNYYICAVEHEITKDNGYLCYPRMYKNASNKLKVNDDVTKVEAEYIGMVKNLTTANPTEGTSKMVTIPIIPD